jgi:hypothetical protein
LKSKENKLLKINLKIGLIFRIDYAWKKKNQII